MAKKKFGWVAGEEDVVEAPPPTRASLKRRDAANEALVLRLLALTDGQVRALDLEEDFLEALYEARRLGDRSRHRGARRRQIRTLVGLLRDEDTDAIEAQL